MYSSPFASWNTTCKKFQSPTNVKHSPIIPICGKLLPKFKNDPLILTLTWALTTTEENYYQNTIELFSLRRNNLEKTNILLRTNRLLAYWPDRLRDFYSLGSGSFGTVYKVTDKITGIDYALKRVTTSLSKSRKKFFQAVMSIFAERRSHLKVNDSQFIVRMHGAFQDANQIAYWLLFEYCIGDLYVYMQHIEIDMEDIIDDFYSKTVVEEQNQLALDEFGLDVESIGCLFSFELLAGISYLAKRHLVHHDLKPENVLVSQWGHLKIADLGLAQRVQWLDKLTVINKLHPNELEINTKERRPTFLGNRLYTDPEALIQNDLVIDKKLIYKRFPNKSFPLRNGERDFLTDLFGVALMIMELLLVGLNFISPKGLSDKIINRFSIDVESEEELELLPIRCIYDEDMHKNYLTRILKNQMTESNKSIIEFLLSCFQPKSKRALEYTKPIEYRKLKDIVSTRYIDMEKVQEIEYYNKRNITEYNVCSQKLPPEFLKIYEKKPTPVIARSIKEVNDSTPTNVYSEQRDFKIPYFQYVS